MSDQARTLRQAETLFTVGALGAVSDARLLEQFLEGRRAVAQMAFETLVQRHGPMVLGVCRAVLNDAHAAQDAFQATFLVLVRKADRIGSPDLLGNWLYGVAHRTARKARTQAARRLRHERRVAEMTTEALDVKQDRSELAGALHRELSRLPQVYRVPVVLCHLEGLSYAAAAQRLKVSEDTVRGRLARARGLLRQRLSRHSALLGSGSFLTEGHWKASVTIPPGLIATTVRVAIDLASGLTSPAGFISAGVVPLSKGVLRIMLFAKLKTAVGFMLLMGIAAIGVRAITVNSAFQGPQSNPPLRINADAGDPSPPIVLAGATQATTARRRDIPGGVDEGLARAVDGHIVKALPITKDCMVLSYLPDWSHGNVDNIGIANNDGGVRTLLNWGPISSSDVNGRDRRFVIALYSRKTDAAGKQGPILAFEITDDWPERTSWKNQPEYASEPAAQFKFVPDDGWKLFDISPLVRSKPSGGGKHGVLLRWLSEDHSGAKKNWSGYQFVSREGAGEWASRRPVLLVIEPGN